MKKSFFANPALTLALAVIAPVFFVFSRNWHMIEPHALLLSCGGVLFLACILLFIVSAAIRVWRKAAPNFPRWARLLVAAGFCLLLAETGRFFFYDQLAPMLPDPRWLRTLVSHVLPCIVLLALIRTFGFYPVNVFLTVFWGFSLVNLGIPLLAEEPPLLEDRSLAAYEITNRPNIYLFFLESYHSLDVQREIYGIDTSGFETYLANNNFVDYGKVYANSSATLISFADTFRLSSSRAYARGNNDAARSIRRMLGGTAENTLFRTLKTNGYTVVFLTENPGYYGANTGEFLDDSDRMASQPLISQVISCIGMVNGRLRDMNRFTRFSRYPGSLEAKVSRAAAIHMRPESPLFLVFKGGAFHTSDNASYSWRQHADWVRSGKYQGAVERGTRELQRICDRIIADDPGAMIILIGDHGATRFRYAESGGSITSVDDLIARVQEKGIAFRDFCDDRHAVFLGIRLPYGQREDISDGLVMSHVNLFRHVFAWLNRDKSILATRVPSSSYWGDFAIVTDGKAVSK